MLLLRGAPDVLSASSGGLSVLCQMYPGPRHAERGDLPLLLQIYIVQGWASVYRLHAMVPRQVWLLVHLFGPGLFPDPAAPGVDSRRGAMHVVLHPPFPASVYCKTMFRMPQIVVLGLLDHR